MSELLSPGFDEVLVQKMVDLSTDFVAEQVAIDPSVGFHADKYLLDAPSSEELAVEPWAIWGVETVQEAQQGNSRDQRVDSITVVCDLYVRKAAELGGVDDQQQALRRLSYLKEQIRAIIFRKANYHLGFAPGTIARKRGYRFVMFAPSGDQIEDWIVGGRVTFDVDASYTPEDVAGVPINTVSVDAGKLFSGLYPLKN